VAKTASQAIVRFVSRQASAGSSAQVIESAVTKAPKPQRPPPPPASSRAGAGQDGGGAEQAGEEVDGELDVGERGELQPALAVEGQGDEDDGERQRRQAPRAAVAPRAGRRRRREVRRGARRRGGRGHGS
jgi:hypothetical protein